MANLLWATATSGNWDDTTKWMPSGDFPDTGDNAFITTLGSYTVTVDDTFGPENLTFNDASGILDIGGDHLFVDTSTTFTAGTITLEGGEFDAGVNGMATSAGATLIGWGLVDHEITGGGTVVAASNQTLHLADAITDAATHYNIQANATLLVDQLHATNVTFSFLGSTGSLDSNDNFVSATISGLVAGNSLDPASTNVIDLAGVDSTTVDVTQGSGTGTTGTIAFDDLLGSHTFTLTNIVSNGGPWELQVFDDGNQGTQLFLSTVCYAAGTLILTANGEVPVEQLAPGDLLVTLDRGSRTLQPVKWIGERRLDLAAHPRPELAAPVRIRKDAFSEGIPARDLLLSPEHCIFADGKLIPVRLLVNSMTIVQECSPRHVHYYHVEMARHSLLLAEGLPAESYLDTGNRAFFSNAGLALVLHPEFHVNAGLKCWELDACAPLAVGAAAVEPVWHDLASRAESLGYERPAIETTDDPDLHIVADGRAIPPLSVQGSRYLFVIPAGTVTTWLKSRASAPSSLAPYLDDRRRLGVAIKGISVRGPVDVTDYPADHPVLSEGWFRAEGDGSTLWRWTNGNASLPITTNKDPLILEVRVGPRHTYALQAVQPARRIVA
jgi:hypothetical protein